MKTFIVILMIMAVSGTAVAQDLGNTRELPVKDSLIAKYTPPPAGARQGGDTIFTPFPIPSLPYSVSGTTAGYADDYDEVCSYPGSTSPDVVYSFVPDSDVTIRVDLCGSSYDTKTYIYDGALDLVACNDDYYFDEVCGNYVSAIDAAILEGGITYYIVVDGYGGDFGDYEMEVTELIPIDPCILVCPPLGVAEGEPTLVDEYEDSYNGGCNSPAFGNPFQLIEGQGVGEVLFCGKSGWYNVNSVEARDTDWFIVRAGPMGIIEISIDAELEVVLFEMGPQDCPVVGVLQEGIAGPCNPWTMVLEYAPGDSVWIWVGPTAFIPPAGFLEHEFDYEMFISGIMVEVPTGTVVVDPDPDILNAPWHLGGPDGYTLDGTGDETLMGLSPGGYTLIWGDVSGWTTPDPNPVIQNLPNGGLITFSGTYEGGAEVGDWVWWDDNANGIQDLGESGCGHGYIQLFDSDDNFIAWTTSEAGPGHYSFIGLGPGDYYLTFQGLADDSLSPWDVGDDQYDSDMNGDLGRTAIFTLTAGQVDHSWDCGFYFDGGGVEDGDIPNSYALQSNVPNPFNPQTTIAFEIPEQQAVTLRVFDMSGRLVRELISSEPHTPGRHEVVWNGRDDTGRQVASGTYFYRLEAGSYSETKRMVLVK